MHDPIHKSILGSIHNPIHNSIHLHIRRLGKKAGMMAASSVLCLSMAVPAHALGISKVSMASSSSVKKGKTASYALALKYDTVAYNIPLPTSCKLGIELPQSVFKSVKFVSGSYPMTFTKCRGAKTGQMSFQCYKSFRVTGKATKSFSVRGTAVNKAKRSGKVNMGTGSAGFGVKLTDWNRCFTVTTK